MVYLLFQRVRDNASCFGDIVAALHSMKMKRCCMNFYHTSSAYVVCAR